MPPADEHNRIEDLKRSLYSRNAPDVRTRRKFRFSGKMSEVKNDWQEEGEKPAEPVVLNRSYEDHSMSFFTKLLIASVVFCAAAVGIGAYIFLNGANFISADNISITINGPVSISAGSPLSLDITVTNKNNVALQTADLAVNFPAGSTDPADTTKSLQQYQQVLGDIPPGGSVTKTVDAVIFGEENLQKEISATVTYGIKGSSSVFTKTQSYDVLINSSPATLTASSFKEVTSGQAFDTTVVFTSNSVSTLKGVIIKATYPFGYVFGSSSIQPRSDKATWVLGDIPAGGRRTLVIHGTLSGEDSDVRAFHFSAGTQDPSALSNIATVYAEAEQDVTIQKSFISVGLGLDGDTSSQDYVTQSGRSVQVAIPWQNNVPETLSNVVVTAHLSGSAYASSQVNPNGTYFRSATNDLVWNQQVDPQLSSVAAGDGGTFRFSITPINGAASGVQTIDPAVTIAVTVSADRTQETGVSGDTAPITRNIKLASDASLSGRIVRAAGPFPSSGPIPPKVDQKTTYTVVWTVDNTSSTLSHAQVTATLPPGVSWIGQISPGTENVAFDQPSGAITWDVGSVSTYTNGTSQRRSVAFQVALQPSADQEGSAPIVLNQATLTATDDWSGTTLTDTQGPLTTSYSTDPSFHGGDEVVGK